MKKLTKSRIAILFLSCAAVFSLSAAGKSKDIMSLYNQGIECQQNENYYLASQYFLEITAENPAFTDAWYKLSECSYKLGELNLALQYLENAEKYEKENSRIKNLKGMIYISLGEIDEGRKVFEEVLKKYPNDIDSHFGLAEIELYEGRSSGAENQYAEALKRQNTNRKALLSLALVSAENGKYDKAETYLHQAFSYYSGEPEVHYLAAIVYRMKGDLKTAEKHCRIAVEVNGDYEKAYELLSTVLYEQGRYSEVIDISDFLIRRNRKNANAWYIKGSSQLRMGKSNDAIGTWSTGLSIAPQDELMRSAMEMEIRDTLPLTDARRKQWAEYHLNNARQYAGRYDGSGAVYEYQRALILDPMNYEARTAYANILEMNGMYEFYLEQLRFIKANNDSELNAKQKTELADKTEAYEFLLKNNIAEQWKVDSLYLDKTRWNIAIFYEENASSFVHADANKLASSAAADIFSGIAITSVKTQVKPVEGFGEAFKNARAGKFDYFILLSLNEGQNDLTLNSKIYSGRTGLEIADESFYAIGNNRLSTTLRRFRNSVLEKLPLRGKILQRNGKTVLVDIGRAENVVKDSEFKIVRKGQVKTADSESGLTYKDNDVVGTLVITEAGEEVSVAVIKRQGFYDRINEEDEIVLVSLPQDSEEKGGAGAIDTVPLADEKGNAVVEAEVKGEEFVEEIRKAVSHPSILELLRNIY